MQYMYKAFYIYKKSATCAWRSKNKPINHLVQFALKYNVILMLSYAVWIQLRNQCNGKAGIYNILESYAYLFIKIPVNQTKVCPRFLGKRL